MCEPYSFTHTHTHIYIYIYIYIWSKVFYRIWHYKKKDDGMENQIVMFHCRNSVMWINGDAYQFHQVCWCYSYLKTYQSDFPSCLLFSYIYIYIYIYTQMELPWLENLPNTRRDSWNHWTAVLTLLGLISSIYHDLHHWRSNQQPQNTEPKLPLKYWSTLHTSDAKLTSHNIFSSHGNSVHNI